MSIATTSWRALGTSVHVLVTEPGRLPAASAAVGEVLEKVDRTYSRFRADSELTSLNRSSGARVSVSTLLAAAIEAAMRAARLSGGAVDPTVGRAMRAIGYDDDFPRVAARTGSFTVRIERVPGWRAIDFDREALTVRVPAGVELDFGSTGKALAADLATDAAFQATGGFGVLVNLGGDIATAGAPPDGGWRILVTDDSSTPPDATGVEGEAIAVRSGAVATSSTLVRRWTADGLELHHIVDPATGLPAHGPWRTASVLAATCVDANTAATAAIVLGDRAPRWLSEQGLAARLVDGSGAVQHLGGWPRPAPSVAPSPKFSIATP